ncbi:phage major capsid protein [Streptomyces sp. DH37]|uniref:phage major capsid protein n=1 Tax=Streptomyces sp. DH37 TaxID=3040122 RepID=UPI0024423146|nr:phage major capsid protein [Streptomyces sp. DH37]MDG9703807.1 phage major capsid protein [Streptomyces sp. DH37]
MPHPLLVRAAQCIEQARALNDEFDDKTRMPAEVTKKIDLLLGEASKCKKQVERETRITEMDNFLSAPDFKHDMSGTEESGGMSVAEIGGVWTTDKQRKDAQQKAFFDFVRKGHAGMKHEYKADLVEDAEGQVLVPADFVGTILRELPREATIRPLATVRPTSSNKMEIGVVNVAAAGWGKLETGAALADGLPADPADKDTIEVHDLNALVKIGVDELDDANDDLAAIISQALSLKIAEQEDDAFANGSGAGRPEGMAAAATVTQGVAAAAGQTVTGDELKRVTFAVPSQFRRNGVWLGHTSAEEKIALLKDGDGRYLLQPNLAAGEPPTLMGYRWYTVDGLPAITTTADAGAGTDKSVIFGDVRQGYMIADRRRLTVTRLVERYADEGKIGLLFRHRVGGAVIRPKAFAWYRL